MKHLFVSPHFDDAVGSCGGTISRLRRSCEEVAVFTVCGASPSPPYSRFARELHAKWNGGESPVAVRRAEDARACHALGCTQLVSQVLDAIYRKSPAGAYPYPDRDSLFGLVADEDGSLPSRIIGDIRACWPETDTRFYFPLGVGHHVDHVVAFHAGLEALRLGWPVTFYRDFYYTDWDSPHLKGRSMRATVEAFSDADFERKVEAFGYYQSQIPILFGSAGKAASYFAEVNRQPASQFGEVFWRPE